MPQDSSSAGWYCVRGNSHNTASLRCRPLQGRVAWESERIGFGGGPFTSTPVFRSAEDLYVAAHHGAVALPFGAVVVLDGSSGRRKAAFLSPTREDEAEAGISNDLKKRGALAPVLDNADTAYFWAANDVIHAQSNRLSKSVWEYHRPYYSRMMYPGVLDAKGNLYFGGENNEVLSVDRTTGRLRWKIRYESPFRCPPAVNKDTLFIGSRFGMLYALNTQTGRPRWQLQTDGMLDWSSPTIYRDLVLIGLRKAPVVMAVRVQDGTICWRTPLRRRYADVVSSGALDESGIYIVACGGYLCAMNALSGRVVWNCELSQNPLEAPVTGGGLVYTGDEQSLYAVDVRSGQRVWKLPVGIQNSPSLSTAGYLYAPTSKGTIVAIA